MNENFTNDGMGQSGNSGNVMPPKPNNNLIFAIFTTICCCLPLGIYAIILANKVNTYYMTNQYELAVVTANDVKKWCWIGVIISVVCNLAYFGIFGFGSLASILNQ